MKIMKLFSVLVTGSNRGIGLEFVRQFVQSDDPPTHVFATYRDQGSIKELQNLRNSAPCGSTLHMVKMDVREEKDIESTKQYIEKVVGDEGLTLLINNAGVAQTQPFPDVKTDNLHLHFAVNCVGPFLLAQAMHPLLKKASSKKEFPGMNFTKAAILNMSTIAGSINNAGVEFTLDLSVPSYKISKAALNMSMRVIAAKVKEDAILTVMMCPGWVKTDMGTEHGKLEPEESITTMLDTISKLNENHHGKYVDRFGNTIPW